MPVDVRQVYGTESDFPLLQRCAAIEVAAFADSHVNPVVFPGPFPEDSGDFRAKELLTQLREEPASRLLVAVDPDVDGHDGVLGWAKWSVFIDGIPAPKKRVFGPGINAEAAQLMFGSIDQMRDRNVTGKACVYLQILVVDPKHQGRGVGRQLMSWGMQEAARLGISSFLESSEAGHPLYTKCGYKDIEKIEVSFEKYGLDRPFVNWAMIWEPPTQRCP